MKNKVLILVLLIILAVMPIKALSENYHFEHYSTENGLPQYTVMSIIQDKKGFMWLGTWDGLSKFDGYNFRNFKVQAGDQYYMRSNRIEELTEDNYNRIWIHTYDGETHCFNPRTEKYWSVQALRKDKKAPFIVEKIITKPSGHVWLCTNDKGCALVSDENMTVRFYNAENETILTNTVINVYEDNSKLPWLLTNNGLYQIVDSQKIVKYFVEDSNKDDKDKQSFFSACQIANNIWFGSDKGRIWRYHQLKNNFELFDTGLQSDIIEIKSVSTNELLIVSRNNGFLLYNIRSGLTKLFPLSQFQGFPGEIIRSFSDRWNNIWFETNTVGIYKYSKLLGNIKNFRVEIEDAISTVFPAVAMVFDDTHGNTWIQPKGGGFSRYNPHTDTLEPFFNKKSSTDWRFSNILHSALSDKQGNLWISTRSHGLEKIVFAEKTFFNKAINPEIQSEVANDVRAVYEDRQNRLWVATKDTRISILDKDLRLIGRLTSDGRIAKDAFMPAMVYSFMEDRNGNIWVGTKGNGVFVYTPSLDEKKYTVKHYSRDPNNLYSLSDNNVYSIFQDSRNQIWIATYGGGLNLVHNNIGNHTFINHRNNLKNYPVDMGLRLRYITEDKKGNLCLGSTGGLIMFKTKFKLPENIDYKVITRLPGDKKSLSNNDVHGIHFTRNNHMYLATFGGGINKASEFDQYGFPTAFKSFGTREGLPSEVILAIVEDKSGMLWVSSENNITKFNPHEELFESFAEVRRMMSVSNFSEASVIKRYNNQLVFGYSGGIICFDPGKIDKTKYQPYIALSKFMLFNKELSSADNSVLTSNIDDMERIVLKHNQNSFSISYAALDFIDPNNIQYAYKLDGFDKEWNYVQKQRIANYTNLPRGKYNFLVKSTNSEGLWINNERKIAIEVLPSFWETPWAYLLYASLIAALFFVVLRILFTIYRLKENVVLEKRMSELKLRFFTDISHEIRTPLTMITAPIDYLLNDDQTPKDTKKQLKKVSYNTERMLRLVNQILDFRKIQFTHLKIQEVEMALLVAEMCDNFTDIALKQNINFQLINNIGIQKIWIDPDCIEKIVMNLLSNAFKFTPRDKNIRVLLNGDDKSISIVVSDQGIGISPEKMKNLFTRFASFSNDKSKPSTGIGLSMIHELAEKHRAKVNVETAQNVGTSITVTFLRGLDHFDNSVEIIRKNIEQSELTQPDIENMQGELNTKDSVQKKHSRPTVLIVEDDADLRQFITDILEKEYHIHQAADGVEGFEKALELVPDFIVSDVMMPRMDGMEMLQNIKKHLHLSHIPIVLLTAKTTIESKLAGMSFGADDYITKPFSVSYFKARINNLLTQRKQLQEYFMANLANSETEAFKPKEIEINSHDKTLMSKVLEIVEENIENSEFTVEELSQQINLSRSVFFKKIKSVTGLNPIEFIRDIRMQRAAQILQSSEFRVKEVSYMVGVTDTKYFAKCFRTKYGLNPLEYKNKFKKDIDHINQTDCSNPE